MLAVLIDTDALLKVLLYSFGGALGMTLVFSLGIVGVTRFDDSRQAGRRGVAMAYGALAVIAALVVIAATVEAIIVMTSK